MRSWWAQMGAEATKGRTMWWWPIPAPSASAKVLHWRRHEAIHWLVVDMGLGFVLWWKPVWANLQCACLPCKAVESICTMLDES